LVLAIPVVFLSHFLRAWRWRYLLAPIARLDLGILFSSLMIGYAANIFMPAHLGEILRAYVLGKKRPVSASSVFATIVLERIIDVFALLALMVLAILVFPFPGWLKNAGYIMLGGSVGLLVLLILLKTTYARIRPFLDVCMRPLPGHLRVKVWDVLERFIAGIVPLTRPSDYVMVILLSMLIWVCYGMILYLTLQSFGLNQAFHLPWSASLILLVVTTIGVVVPSSPGYVGTYHYLCQVSLAMFGVPASPALSFATIVHAVNFLPVLIVGLIFAYAEGVEISQTKDLDRSRHDAGEPNEPDRAGQPAIRVDG
jgi:uncharacterized protein (TIRG00374 family)